MAGTLIFVTGYPQAPLNGTALRTMEFVRFFRAHGPVDIAYTVDAGDQGTKADGFRSMLQLSRDSGHRSRRTQLLRGLVDGLPWPVYRFDPASQRRLLSQIQERDYRHIVVRYAHNTAPFWALPRALRERVVVDLDDLQSGTLYNRILSNARGVPQRLIYRVNRRALARYEHRCLAFGVTLVCSESDQRHLTEASGRRPTVVPNVFEPPPGFESAVGAGQPHAHRLLFVGTLSYGPNVDGLRWFLSTIFPALRQAYPEATLAVAGRKPSEALQSLCAATAGVTLHADPPDLAPYYRHASVAIVPLFEGGGTRLKILEAIAAGRPVLSTPIGAEGLRLQHDRDCLLFRDAAEFLAGYARLAHAQRYETMVTTARAALQAAYTRAAFDAALTAALWPDGAPPHGGTAAMPSGVHNR